MVSLSSPSAFRYHLDDLLYPYQKPSDFIKFSSPDSRYVPPYVFSEKMYPDYLSGTGYVMSTDIVSDLLRMTERTPFFHLEDIYVTGKGCLTLS